MIVLDSEHENTFYKGEERLIRYKNCINYELAVLNKPPTYLTRMLIINGVSAHLRIPSKIGKKQAELCMEFFDRDAIEVLDDWFDTIHAEARILKEKDKELTAQDVEKIVKRLKTLKP